MPPSPNYAQVLKRSFDADANALRGIATGEGGGVAGNVVTISTEKTRPADTTAYAAKDAIAEATSGATVWTFTGVAGANGGSGYIVGAIVSTDKNDITPRLRLHLFHTTPTALQDNAACTAPLYADLGKYVGSLDIDALGVSGTGSTASWVNMTPGLGTVPMPFKCADADDDLYGILETRDAFTPASGQKITVILQVARN